MKNQDPLARLGAAIDRLAPRLDNSGPAVSTITDPTVLAEARKAMLALGVNPAGVADKIKAAGPGPFADVAALLAAAFKNP